MHDAVDSDADKCREKPETTISCRLQTRATRCITANVLQTSKAEAQCDKLATALS